MSKAVLVMDMPSSCMECPLGKNMSNSIEVCIQCPLGKCAVDAETETRQDWCPLRELPEKSEVSDCDELCDTDDWYDSGYTDGYNACIDELLKGEEG